MNRTPKMSELASSKRTLKFFEELLRSTPNGIVVTDLSQNIVIVNEKFGSFFCEHWWSIIETNLFVWLQKLDNGAVDQWTKSIESVYRDGFCYDIKFGMTTNGEARHLSVNASLVEQHKIDDYGIIISIWDDTTKQIQMEEQIIASERLAVLGKLSGSIAHEIRNPLATIDITALNLKKRLNDIDEKTESQIDQIIKQVKEITDTIQSLQDLAKLETLQKERLDLGFIIEDGLRVLQIPRSITIVIGLTRNDIFVDIDKKQFVIVFRNILFNAFMAMDNSGTIKITACKGKGGGIEVSIKDTGHGIAPENLKKIFQPFFGTKTKGFGYGLTICRVIMEKHGGSIDVQSEVDKGTTFILHFPSDVATK